MQKLETPQGNQYNQYTEERKGLESENTNLRMALLTALQGLSDQPEEEEEEGAAERGLTTTAEEEAAATTAGAAAR